MELPALLPPPTSPPRAGVLPVVLAALVSAEDDARGFRRYPTALEVGVRLDAECAPHRQNCQSCRAVLASDLSLTGLYLVTALPYPVGVRLEVRVALPGRALHLPAVVRRLDAPARTALGLLETAYGCGVDFRHRETSAQSRRALMEFLVRRAVPA